MMATASSVRLLIRYTGMQACMILLELNVAIIWSCLANDSNSSLRIIITLDFSHYLSTMRTDSTWGGELEIRHFQSCTNGAWKSTLRRLHQV